MSPNSPPSNRSNSRREFLRTTTAGAVALSTGAVAATSPSGALASPGRSSDLGELRIVSDRVVAAGGKHDLHLAFTAKVDLQPGAKLWLFFEDRQGAAVGQIDEAAADNFLSVRRSDAPEKELTPELPRVPRTLDLFPVAPEFFHMIGVTLDDRLAAGGEIAFQIRRWKGPRQPIAPYQFWLVVDDRAEWDFEPIDFRRYRKFVNRQDQSRVPTQQLREKTLIHSLRVTGKYAPVAASSLRRKPGVFWGEFHGMVFNQRPLDDYYRYAKSVAKLDFCAPFWFSYGTCVEDVWQKVKEASRRHTEPGKFAALAGFECGTPPDDSHRCVLFRDPDKVPPIFCDSRPPAQDPFHQSRLHPETVVCKTLPEFYETIERFGGIVTGHFHTRHYDKEVLAEIYQKNLRQPAREEERIYELMRRGKRFALAGTSDTHDSMPGNPFAEPHLPMAAGFTGVYADALTADALLDAVVARRTFATSGTRMFMNLQSNGQPLGAELPIDAPRVFSIEVDAAGPLDRVELLRDGRTLQTWTPTGSQFTTQAKDDESSASAFYLVRARQQDGHQGWTSPIWFG